MQFGTFSALLACFLLLISHIGVSVAVGDGAAAELVGPRLPGPSRSFITFRNDVERLNSVRSQEQGHGDFVAVDEIGKHTVQLTAHPDWIQSPLIDRQSSLQLLVNLWSLRSAVDTGVTLLIVDERGLPLMKGSL